MLEVSTINRNKDGARSRKGSVVNDQMTIPGDVGTGIVFPN